MWGTANVFGHKRYMNGASTNPDYDVVARAIDNEMKRSGEECVFLDITHKTEEELRLRFPNIFEKCFFSQNRALKGDGAVVGQLLRNCKNC